MRKYEAMLILPAEADDGVITTVTDRIGQVLGESGGEVGSVDRWGRRRLAFELAGHSEGYYLVVAFTGDPGAIKELDRVLSLVDEVIRFKVVVRDDQAKAPAGTSARA